MGKRHGRWLGLAILSACIVLTQHTAHASPAGSAPGIDSNTLISGVWGDIEPGLWIIITGGSTLFATYWIWRSLTNTLK